MSNVTLQSLYNLTAHDLVLARNPLAITPT
jgi:hypothetical protein